ncbi:MAG: hypothetical protein ACE5G8_00135, partial [Anaerolineae bacterium]
AGRSYSAGQLGFVVLSALLPPLGFAIARRVSGNERRAWLAGLLLLFSGFYFPVWTAIDTFAPCARCGALGRLAGWRARDGGGWRWSLGAGARGGLAHLTRADGPLLPAAVAMVCTVRAFYDARPGARGRSAVVRVAWLACGYLLVMAPWFLRNVQATGAPLPAGGGRTMWLQSYNQIFSYGAELSWQSYRAWGWGPAARSKLWAGWINLQPLFAVQGLIVAFFPALAGWWQLKKHPLFQMALLYALLLLGAMTLVFTFPGPRGALFHSGGAMLPCVLSAAAQGLDAAVDFAARKRPTWNRRAARRLFGGALVVFAAAISLYVYAGRLKQVNYRNDAYPQIATYLAGQQATVMIGNPPAYLYHGGYRAISVPNEPLETTLRVADRYGATYLALDDDHPPPLEPYVLGGAAHPRLHAEKRFAGPVILYRIEP